MGSKIKYQLSIVVILSFCNLSIFSQEISTIGEIYDFEIGDIFHYIDYGSFGGGNYGFTEKIQDNVIDKYYSINNDTVYYLVFHQTSKISDEFPYWQYDTSTITRFYSTLDSLVYYGNIDTVYTNPDQFNGRKINYSHYSEVFGEDTIRHYKKWVEGCGKTLDSYHDQFWWNHADFTLEYYKKGNEEWGTPLIIFTSVENFVKDPNILIYPNPVKNKINIDLNNCNTQFDKLDLLSMKGELIMSQKIEPNQINQIGISDIQKGIYLLNLVTEIEIYSSKIVKK